jgi:hypothetical protein
MEQAKNRLQCAIAYMKKPEFLLVLGLLNLISLFVIIGWLGKMHHKMRYMMHKWGMMQSKMMYDRDGREWKNWYKNDENEYGCNSMKWCEGCSHMKGCSDMKWCSGCMDMQWSDDADMNMNMDENMTCDGCNCMSCKWCGMQWSDKQTTETSNQSSVAPQTSTTGSTGTGR